MTTAYETVSYKAAEIIRAAFPHIPVYIAHENIDESLNGIQTELDLAVMIDLSCANDLPALALDAGVTPVYLALAMSNFAHPDMKGSHAENLEKAKTFYSEHEDYGNED